MYQWDSTSDSCLSKLVRAACECVPYAVCTVLGNLEEDNSIRRNWALRYFEDEFLDSSLESRTGRLVRERNGPTVSVRRLEDVGEREEAGSAQHDYVTLNQTVYPVPAISDSRCFAG